MSLITDRTEKIGEVKKNVKNTHTCPVCKQDIEIGVELLDLKNANKNNKFPYPHIHLHGDPLHAMLCYIDKHLTIRSTGVIKSIEISRDSATFSHLIRKWSNPY